MNLQPGQMLTPTLRLQRQLGRGGMGSIWIADHLSLETPVAVKFMAPELVANSEVRARFAREAAAASQVKSPHVVQMLDHGVTPDGIPFIAMELLQGEDLAHRVKRRGLLTPVQLSQVLTQTAKALSRAHERGIVHRDIKPENIFLCETDDDEIFVKVLDFGIAKASDSLSSSTKTGSVMGTAYYMSPEQIVGAKNIDHRTDVWALGVVAYEMMTGVKPFDGETIGALTLAIHGGSSPRPTAHLPGATTALDDWFARACAKDLNQRFQSAKDLARAFAEIVGVAQPAARLADQSSPGLVAPPQFGPPQFGQPPPPPGAPSQFTPPHTPSQQYGSQPQYPLPPFSATTMGAHTSSTSGEPAAPTPAMTMTSIPKSSTGLYFALGAGALVAIGAIVFFVTRSDAPEPPPTIPVKQAEPEVTTAPTAKKKPPKKPVEDEPTASASTSVKPPATPTVTATATATATGKTTTTTPTATSTGKTLSTGTTTATTTKPTSTQTSEPKIF